LKKKTRILGFITGILVSLLILGMNGAVAVNGSNVASQEDENVKEICIEVDTPDDKHLLGGSDGKNNFKKSIHFYGYKYELWMDHETTQDVIHVSTGASGISTVIAAAASGITAGVAGVFAGVLVTETALLNHCDEGQGVKVTLHVAWSGNIIYQNMDGQHEDGDWWPWSQDRPVATSVGRPI